MAKANSSNSHGGSKAEIHHHHILPYQAIAVIGVCLMILTAITVLIAHIDLGRLNFLIALLIATAKGLLVALFFMNLRYDRRENGMIFATSFVFLAIFITLTSTDLFFRGDVYVKPGQLVPPVMAKSKLKNPWISTPELIAHGKELFMQNCVTCHGPEGLGNGVAAAGLNPPPRNFHQIAGWKNGRKASEIFKTLKEGVKGSAMASWASLPADDRWALAHYVISFGPPSEKDTPKDLAAIGYGPGGQVVAEAEAPSIPVDLAMERIEQSAGKYYHPAERVPEALPAYEGILATSGSQIYMARCAQCHGDSGQGGIRVGHAGVFPKAYVVTRAFNSQLESIRSAEAFDRVVIDGLPGNLMPGYGQLSSSELAALYDYIRSIASKNVAAR